MSEQAALDKKAIRKEILALIIPIILESIFVYLAGIVSASLVGHLSGLAVATQGLANRITGLLNVVWGAVRIGSMVYYVYLIGEGKYGELKQEIRELDRLIEELSSYMRSSGKQYADHAVTLRRWAERSAPVKNIPDYTCSEEDSL